MVNLKWKKWLRPHLFSLSAQKYLIEFFFFRPWFPFDACVKIKKMNGVHCNALVTLLKGAVGLRDPFDSQCLLSAPTSAAFTVQICSDREKLCSQTSPPVTGPSSCCDINYRVFPYVPYVRGQGPSFTPVWNLRTLTPVKIRSIYYGSFLHQQHIFRRTVCFSVIL